MPVSKNKSILINKNKLLVAIRESGYLTNYITNDFEYQYCNISNYVILFYVKTDKPKAVSSKQSTVRGNNSLQNHIE